MSAYGTLHTNVPYAPSSKGQLSAAPIGQHFVKIVPRLFIPTDPFSLVYVFRPAHLAGRNKLPATPVCPRRDFVRKYI
jgi:hypothetical protein